MSKNTKPFSPSMFTPTEFYSAEDKAKFANNLAKFLLNGCPAKGFTKPLYQRLSNCFHHIAHFNQAGFYGVWFESYEKMVKWFDHALESQVYGDPAFTFSDVEREFQSWLAFNRAQIFEAFAPRLEEDTANEERAGTEQVFRVIAISSNTGGFGHKQHILLNRHGIGVKGDRQPSYNNPTLTDLKEGDELTFTVNAEGTPTDWGRHGFEFMSRIPQNAPKALLEEVFGK